MMAFEGGVLGSIYKPQVLLHFRLIQENLRVGLDLVERAGIKIVRLSRRRRDDGRRRAEGKSRSDGVGLAL